MKHKLLLALLSISLISQSAWAAKGGKPSEPVIAEDVDCIECVDTVDIADGAVTTDKVSTEFLDIISQLNERIDILEATSSLYAVDGNGNRIDPFVSRFSESVTHFITALTPTGYIFHVVTNQEQGGSSFGEEGDVYIAKVLLFSFFGCQGQPYTDDIDPFRSYLDNGVVLVGYNSTGNKELFSAKSVSLSQVGIASQSGPSGCLDRNPGTITGLIPLIPNDPIETGLSVMQFSTPITIQRAVDTNP